MCQRARTLAFRHARPAQTLLRTHLCPRGRYINHSWKSPNLIVELQTITTGPDNPGFISPSSPASHAVALCAARNLNKGEELTLDYGEG